ncbi:MAG TPA: hypothetical protein VLF41_02560 [Candidatus Nanoarchaeia archaeon]|nr:hypothetical protein [Candidatus Nanoarchaeia archaeon]
MKRMLAISTIIWAMGWTLAVPAGLALAAETCGTGDTAVPIGTVGLKCANGTNSNPIYALLGFAINWMIGIIVALAVLAIVISGIQYITSQGNPEAVKTAKSRITNAAIGLILLSLTRVILGFLKVI